MKENKIQTLIDKGWQLRNFKNFEIRAKEDDTSKEMLIEGIVDLCQVFRHNFLSIFQFKQSLG